LRKKAGSLKFHYWGKDYLYKAIGGKGTSQNGALSSKNEKKPGLGKKAMGRCEGVSTLEDPIKTWPSGKAEISVGEEKGTDYSWKGK